MKFSINSKQLLSALNAVGRVVPAKAAIQVLSSFLIEVKNQEVSITAYDTENRATATVQALTDETGSFCVDARFLTNIIKNLPDGLVTIAVGNNGDVTITTPTNEFNTTSTAGNTYPQPDSTEESVTAFSMPTENLLQGFSDVSFAIGSDDFHPQMMGVCFDVKSDQVVFVATDTRQLAKSVQAVTTDTTARCIIPSKAVSALTSLAVKDQTITITLTPTAIEFKGESFTLRCQLIKGNYPEYDRVIPKSNNLRAVFNRKGLIDAVRRVSTCSDNLHSLICLDLDNSQAEISAKDMAMNRSAKESIGCEWSCGTPMKIGFSAEFLLNQLSAVETDNVVIYISDASRPALFGPDGDDDHLTLLLMPMTLV